MPTPWWKTSSGIYVAAFLVVGLAAATSTTVTGRSNIARNAKEGGTPISFVLDTRTEPLAALSRGPQGEEVQEEDDGAEQQEQ